LSTSAGLIAAKVVRVDAANRVKIRLVTSAGLIDAKMVRVNAAKLDGVAALKSSGSLPENVNYAVKSW